MHKIDDFYFNKYKNFRNKNLGKLNLGFEFI